MTAQTSTHLKLAAACFAAAVMAAAVLGCSSTAVFDARLGKAIEARLDTPGPVSCEPQTRDLWLCSYEPDLGSNSYAELMVRRRSGDCWTARRSRHRTLHGCT